jgi:plasmid stabilization system protein ParE
MAEIIWTDPALADLDRIADYIALDNPTAARDLVKRVFAHIAQLSEHPESGSKPSELRALNYRQIVEPPCRIFYRQDGDTVYVVHVMRGEQRFSPKKLKRRKRRPQARIARRPRH